MVFLLLSNVLKIPVVETTGLYAYACYTTTADLTANRFIV
jgi:hypothetical protein